jgi:hypothetical protein
VKERVYAADVIEKQKIKGAQRWSRSSVSRQEVAEIMQNRFGAAGRPGGKQYQSRIPGFPESRQDRARLPDAVSTPGKTAFDDNVHGGRLKKILMVLARGFGERNDCNIKVNEA